MNRITPLWGVIFFYIIFAKDFKTETVWDF